MPKRAMMGCPAPAAGPLLHPPVRSALHHRCQFALRCRQINAGRATEPLVHRVFGLLNDARTQLGVGKALQHRVPRRPAPIPE
jgi:hypothetical protein